VLFGEVILIFDTEEKSLVVGIFPPFFLFLLSLPM
jgi:hypothetical protein